MTEASQETPRIAESNPNRVYFTKEKNVVVQNCSHTANCNNLYIKSPTRGSLDNFMKALEIGGTFNQFLPFLLLEPSDYDFTAHSEQELPSLGVRRSLSIVTLQ